MRILMIPMFLVIFSQLVLSTPVIDDLMIYPVDAWLGESVTVSLSCSGDDVTASMIGPSIIVPSIEFSRDNYTYSTEIDKSYLDRVGIYTVTVNCNALNDSSSQEASFEVSEFTGYINLITPQPAYLGDVVEIYYIAKKNGAIVISDIGFDLYINGIASELKVPPYYDTEKGWILKFDAPDSSGFHEIEVNVSHDRVSLLTASDLEVRNDKEFEIVSIDKEWVNPGDEINILIKALEEGSLIEIDENNLDIEVGSAKVEIDSISVTDNKYSIKITAPDISPGKYEIKATLSYMESSYIAVHGIDYIVPVSGRFVDLNGKAISTRLRFMLGDEEKLNIVTDSSGSYSSSIPPDKYDIELTFPESVVVLEKTSVNNFDDPIKYYFMSNVKISGIVNYGIYVYESDLSFSDAVIEITYKESDVSDESDLSIFRCHNWNSGKKECSSYWEKLDADIDTVRNKVNLKVGGFSAFALGKNDKISISVDLDKKRFSLNEIIKLSGLLKNSFGDPVENANITAILKGTQRFGEARSDSNGVFKIDLTASVDPGNYTLLIKAVKPPFGLSEYSAEVEIIRSMSLALEFPDTIKLKPGEELKKELEIENTGQGNIFDIEITLSGIDEDYISMNPFIDIIEPGENKRIEITFSVPEDTTPGTTGATIEASGDGVYGKKLFGFTIVNIPEETSQEDQIPTTGFVIDIGIPEISTEAIYVLIFAIIAFSFAFLLRRRKKTEREATKNLLIDVKNYIGDETMPNKNKQSTDEEFVLSKEDIEDFKDLMKDLKDKSRSIRGL